MAFVKQSIAKSDSILKEHNISFHINTSGNPKEAFHYYYNLRKLNSHLFLVKPIAFSKIYTFCTPKYINSPVRHIKIKFQETFSQVKIRLQKSSFLPFYVDSLKAFSLPLFFFFYSNTFLGIDFGKHLKNVRFFIIHN